MSSPYCSSQFQEYIGVVKTLQHTTKLSPKEQELYIDLVASNDEIREWFKLLSKKHGKQKAEELMDIDARLTPLQLILFATKLTEQQVRIALKSMKQGKPTFMDQEIARKFIDHLFKSHHTATVEEAGFRGTYVS